MFKTPVNGDQKSPSLTSGQKTDLSPMYTAIEVSELLTPEESGMFFLTEQWEQGFKNLCLEKSRVVAANLAA